MTNTTRASSTAVLYIMSLSYKDRYQNYINWNIMDSSFLLNLWRHPGPRTMFAQRLPQYEGY